MIKRIYDPIYQDQNVMINVGFMRIQGDIEVLMLLNSFYEYCDVRMLLYQIFGGIDRWIYPQYFTSFIILPHNILNYTYSNPYTGQVYKLNWQQAGIYEKLVRSTAKNEMVLPLEIKPVYKMTGFNDASDRYGGTEKLADWRLGATIRYEIEIPTYFIVESDYLAAGVNIDLRTGSTYSEYSYDNVPVDRFLFEASHDWGLDETSYSTVDLTSDSTSCETIDQGDYQFTTRYYHVVTQAQANSTSNVNITIPETITNDKLLIVSSVLGIMNYGDHYLITNSGNTLQIQIDNVDLTPGQIIELYVYKRNPYA
jgi:hypothetical protein